MLKMFRIWLLILVYTQAAFGVDVHTLKDVLNEKAPFSYPLKAMVLPGENEDSDVMICCHGYGGNASLASVIHSSHVTSNHLVGFNFPDHDILTRKFNRSTVTYGSLQEILPALYILKKIVVDGGTEKVSLYGFSAGGGAIVNIIAVLNSPEYEQSLQNIGIGMQEKSKILAALQKGVILLDAPLKSMDEIVDTRGNHPEIAYIAQRYNVNRMNPIDNLMKWQGLTLSVIVFFQNPDEAVANRDDALYAQRLRQFNPQGRNTILSSNEGGHCGFHHSLWQAYNTSLK